MDQQNQTPAAEPKCPYCYKPLGDVTVSAVIIRQKYDAVRRKKVVARDQMVFCSQNCASNYQMSCEG